MNYLRHSSLLILNRNFGTFSSKAKMAKSSQMFDYFLILDFEATCDRKKQPHPQEIIEFPCLKMNSRSLKIESQFHQYVRPNSHPQLSDFCVELTGIVQDMVDGQPDLESVLLAFDNWLHTEKLISKQDEPKKFAFITCGDWDFEKMLPHQCQYLNLEIPGYFHQWINLKKPFCDATKIWPKGLMHMLDEFKLTHKGRHHSGIDDTLNMSEIVKVLVEQKGITLHETSSLQNRDLLVKA